MLHDKDIRDPLFEFLEEKFGKARFIEEKQIGKSRADCFMVLDEKYVGIEIKSDADTYTRLERQIKDYNRFFDYNIIVVGSSHAKSVTSHVPEYWGIVVASVDISEDEEGDRDDKAEKTGSIDLTFNFLREPERNPKREKKILFRNQLMMLWRPEMVHIQELNSLPKYKQKSKMFVAQMLMERVPEETLKRQMTDELFERDYSYWDKLKEETKEKGNGKKKPSKTN